MDLSMKFAVEYRDKKQQQVESRTSRMLKRNDGISSSNKRANNWILIERHCIKLNHANIFLYHSRCTATLPSREMKQLKRKFLLTGKTWHEFYSRALSFDRWRKQQNKFFIRWNFALFILSASDAVRSSYWHLSSMFMQKIFLFPTPSTLVIAFDKFSFDEWNKCHRRRYFLSTLNSPN